MENRSRTVAVLTWEHRDEPIRHTILPRISLLREIPFLLAYVRSPRWKGSRLSYTIVGVADNGRSNRWPVGISHWKMIILENLIFQLVISDLFITSFCSLPLSFSLFYLSIFSCVVVHFREDVNFAIEAFRRHDTSRCRALDTRRSSSPVVSSMPRGKEAEPVGGKGKGREMVNQRRSVPGEIARARTSWSGTQTSAGSRRSRGLGNTQLCPV